MATAGGIKAGKAFVLIEALDKTGAVLRAVHQRMQGFASRMNSLGRGMVTKGLAGLLPAGLSLKVFADFDDSMRKVEARSAGTAEEMRALRDQAKDLGRTTSNTASQIGELQAKLAQKGFKRSELLQMTPAVRNLSEAAGEGTDEDTTLASDLVGGTLRSFQLGADQAGRVADVMTAAVNNSNFTLQSLIDSMKYAGPVAAQFNLGLEETVATLAQMTNVNLDASTAGTSFRNMLLKLSDAGNRQKWLAKFQQETGKTIELVDGAGNLKALPEILFAIGEATKGLGSAQRADIFNQLFGMRAITGAMVAGANENPFADLLDTLKNSQGVAQTTAEKMNAGLGGAFRGLWSAVEGVAISVGEALTPAVAQLGAWLSSVLVPVAEWIGANKQIVVAAAAVLAGVVGVGAALVGLSGVVSLVGFAFGGLAAIASTAAAVLGVLLSPIGLVVAGIAAAGAAIYHFRDTIAAVFPGVSGQFGALGQAISATFGGVLDALTAGDFEAAWQIVVDGLGLAWSELVGVLWDAWDSFTGFFVEAFLGAAQAVQQTWLSLQKSISTMLLDLAGDDGILGSIASKILGVDMQGEKRRAEKIRQGQLAAGMTAAAAQPDALAEARQAMRAGYDARIAGAADATGAALGGRAAGQSAQRQAREDALAKRRGEFAAKLAAAEKQRAEEAARAADAMASAISTNTEARRDQAGSLAGDISARPAALPPKISQGLERGTAEAMQQFQENRFNNSEFAKMLSAQEEANEHLATIAGNTAGGSEEEGV